MTLFCVIVWTMCSVIDTPKLFHLRKRCKAPGNCFTCLFSTHCFNYSFVGRIKSGSWTFLGWPKTLERVDFCNLVRVAAGPNNFQLLFTFLIFCFRSQPCFRFQGITNASFYELFLIDRFDRKQRSQILRRHFTSLTAVVFVRCAMIILRFQCIMCVCVCMLYGCVCVWVAVCISTKLPTFLTPLPGYSNAFSQIL